MKNKKAPQAKTCGGVQKLVVGPAQGHSWRCGYRHHHQAAEA